MSNFELGECSIEEFEAGRETRLQGDDLLAASGIHKMVLLYREVGYVLHAEIHEVLERRGGVHVVQYNLLHPGIRPDADPSVGKFKNGYLKKRDAFSIPYLHENRSAQTGYLQTSKPDDIGTLSEHDIGRLLKPQNVGSRR